MRLLHLFISVLSIAAAFSAAAQEESRNYPLGPIGGQFRVTPGSSFARVVSVEPSGPGASAGLQVGDYIYGAFDKTFAPTGAFHYGVSQDLGFAVDRAEGGTGVLPLNVLRPGVGALQLDVDVGTAGAFGPVYPINSPKFDGMYESAVAYLHQQATNANGSLGYFTGWVGLSLLGHPDWNSTTGPRPYRLSINLIRDHCINEITNGTYAPVENLLPDGSANPNFAGGVSNWQLGQMVMFLAEYYSKTNDAGVAGSLQRGAEMCANSVQWWKQPALAANGYSPEGSAIAGMVSHGGVTGDYIHLGWGGGINMCGVYSFNGMAFARAAGMNMQARPKDGHYFGFSTPPAGSVEPALMGYDHTLDEKFLMQWNWMAKRCGFFSQGHPDDGHVCYTLQGASAWDAAGRTAGTLLGMAMFEENGGTLSPDDKDRLERLKGYITRHYMKHQEAHAYCVGSQAYQAFSAPFLSDRQQRFFMDNWRFYFALARTHTGGFQYFRARGTNDSYLNETHCAAVNVALPHAIANGRLNLVPGYNTNRVIANFLSPDITWPTLEARKITIAGPVLDMPVEVVDGGGQLLSPGDYSVSWTKVSGPGTVSFSGGDPLVVYNQGNPPDGTLLPSGGWGNYRGFSVTFDDAALSLDGVGGSSLPEPAKLTQLVIRRSGSSGGTMGGDPQNARVKVYSSQTPSTSTWVGDSMNSADLRGGISETNVTFSFDHLELDPGTKYYFYFANTAGNETVGSITWTTGRLRVSNNSAVTYPGGNLINPSWGNQDTGYDAVFSATFAGPQPADTEITFGESGVYRLELTITSGGHTLVEPVDVAVQLHQAPSGYTLGAADYLIYTSITGGAVSDLTNSQKFPNSPDITRKVTRLVGDHAADNFGSRLSGLIIPPVTGTYRFYIAADDTGRLSLNPSGTDSSGASVIATVPSWTNANEWTKHGSQESAAFNLTAGQPMFFEALQKEATGGQNLSVGWSINGGAIQVIDGVHLASSDSGQDTMAIITQPQPQSGSLGGTVTLTIETSGPQPAIYQWRRNGVPVGTAGTSPVLTLSNITGGAEGGYDCVYTTVQGSITSASAQVTVTDAGGLAGGGLWREVYTGISGSTVPDLTANAKFPGFADVSGPISSAATPNNYADSYGQRLTGWVVPVVSGNYRFYLASDDNSEVWLSTNQAPGNRVRILQLSGYTGVKAWTARAPSAWIPLVAGQRYYIEILHKEGGGGDHLAVAWQREGQPAPVNGSGEISGAYLEHRIGGVYDDVPFQNPASSQLAAGLDSDGDGFPNLLELALGTDPQLSSSQPDPIYSGLHSWWRFDELSGPVAADSSGNQMPGAVNNASFATGYDNNALTFAGSGGVLMGPDAALTGPTNFTAAAWVKVDPGSQTMTVVQQREPGGSGFEGQYVVNINATGHVNFFVYNNGYQFNITSAVTVNDGQWHHVAAVRDGTGGYIYIDGVQEGSGSGTVRNLMSRAVAVGYDHRDSNKRFTGQIDDVRVYSRALPVGEIFQIAAPDGLPVGWVRQDVGSTGVPGTATHDSGAFTINGSGTDIWGSADAFHYVYQPLNGDGEIVARVASLQYTHQWAKSGVMIRESLTAGSKHAMMVVSAGSGVSFQRRTTTGGGSTATTTSGIAAPRWMRLVRSGDTFTAYHSSDGSSWTQIGSASIPMASNIHIGLAVCSLVNNTLCETVIDNVAVTP